MSTGGEDATHPGIIADISETLFRGIRRVPLEGEGPGGQPEPDDRPDNKAQWDEVNGRWIDWDVRAQKWAPAPDGAASLDAAMPDTEAATDAVKAPPGGAAEPPADQ